MILPVNGIVDQMRLPQQLFLGITYFVIICLFFINGVKRNYKNKWLALFSFWMFFCIATNFLIPFCIERIGGRAVNLMVLDQMIYFILGLFATFAVLSTLVKEDFVRIAKALCLSACLLSFWAILQFIGFDPFGRIAVYRCGNHISGCLDNPNVVGNYLTLCLPMFLMFRRPIYIFGILLTLVGIGVTNSHFAISLACLGFVIFGLQYYRRNKIVITSILFSCLVGLYAIIKFDFAKIYQTREFNLGGPLAGRWDCWMIGLKALKNNPLFGQGFGCWKSWNVKIATTYWQSVHNDWLEKAIEIGLIGVILALIVVIHSIRKFKFEDRVDYCFFTAFIIFLVQMFFSFPIVTPTVGFLGLVMFWYMEHNSKEIA